MKKLLFFVILLSSISFNASAQRMSIFKGFYTDDLFYQNSYLPIQPLYYISNYGNTVELKSHNAQGWNIYAADSANCKLYKTFQGHLFLSIDTGKTFNPVAEPWGPDTLLHGLKGGENQGLFYFEGAVYPYWTQYKTLDGFQTYSSSVAFPLTVGMKPGAFYAGDIYSSSQPYLTYTNNWGNTFDTNYFTNPSYMLDTEVHADHSEGQLYRIYLDNVWHFVMFFSPDYGKTWIERDLPNYGNIDEGLFAAGRDSCTLYIVNAENTFPSSQAFKLNIWVSRDCGETFNKITHELPTYVGLGDDKQKQHLLTVTPNPASNTTNVHWQQSSSQNQVIQVLSSTGQRVLSKDIGVQPIGDQNFLLDVHTLANGMYQIRLVGDNGEIRCGKLVVCR